jgi:type III secretory pathway component EscV
MSSKKAKSKKSEASTNGISPLKHLGPSTSGQDQKELVDYLQLKITDLSDKLTRSLQKNDLLTVQNNQMVMDLENFRADRKDIVEFLQIKIDENEGVVSRLEDKIVACERDRLVTEREHQSRVKAINDKNAANVERLVLELQTVKDELQQVSKFAFEKDELYNQLKITKSLLEKKEVEYREAVHGLERKVLQDKVIH